MDAFLKPLDLDPARLTKLTIEFGKVFTKLAWDSDNQFLATPIAMPPTNLPSLDTPVLAIDVGGSHLRVGLFSEVENKLNLIPGGDYHVISDSVKGNTAEGLFNLIGERIVIVLQEYLDQSQGHANGGSRPSWELDHELPVGVTFSFPVM
jgi:hexokinase